MDFDPWDGFLVLGSVQCIVCKCIDFTSEFAMEKQMIHDVAHCVLRPCIVIPIYTANTGCSKGKCQIQVHGPYAARP